MWKWALCLLSTFSLHAEIFLDHSCFNFSSQFAFEFHSDEFTEVVGKDPRLVLLATDFDFAEDPIFFSDKERKKEFFLFKDRNHECANVIMWQGLDPFDEITEFSWRRGCVLSHPLRDEARCRFDFCDDFLRDDLRERKREVVHDDFFRDEISDRRIEILDGDICIKSFSHHHAKIICSSNDLIFKSDGTIWFTNTGFRHLHFPHDCQMPNHIFCFDPKTNELTAIRCELKMPMAIAFSHDERYLFVIDCHIIEDRSTFHPLFPSCIFAFDFEKEGRSLCRKRLFSEISPGFCAGLRIDHEGNLFVGALDGVHIFNKKGRLLGKILLPKEVDNLTFGGKDNNILFICSSGSVWAIKLKTRGSKPILKLNHA